MKQRKCRDSRQFISPAASSQTSVSGPLSSAVGLRVNVCGLPERFNWTNCANCDETAALFETPSWIIFALEPRSNTSSCILEWLSFCLLVCPAVLINSNGFNLIYNEQKQRIQLSPANVCWHFLRYLVDFNAKVTMRSGSGTPPFLP